MLQPPSLQLQVKMELHGAGDGAVDPPQLGGLKHVQRPTRQSWLLQEALL